MRTVYREKKYTCGEYLDVYIYPVFEIGKPGGGKREKRKPSTEAQKKLNQRHREEKLVRLLHANFTPEDLEIHLTYKGEQPGSNEEAARNLRNYIRRIQRLRKKMGLPPLKYIAVTERGKRGGRYHHHITVNGGIDRDTLESMWEYGYANSRRLQFTEDGLAGLGNYIVKSPVGGKAWTASKNLVDPEPRTRDGRISGSKARELAKSLESGEKFAKFESLYPGYLMSAAEAFHNDVNGGCYLVARFYREDGQFIRPKQKPKQKQKKQRGGRKHGTS
ncbi:hypothetical protein D3Z52_08130 [Clostridiaceae bacterium]|nr:hypothetical protein [Clostridiaceae bacterium]